MVYRNGMRQELSKKDQILTGILKGTLLLHAIPSGSSTVISDIKEKDPEMKSSPLEKISMGITTLAEGVGYYGLAKIGIPAYYLPALTNFIDLIGRGTFARYFVRKGEETIHYMING